MSDRLDPQKQRQFAVEAVRTLRGAGFAAYWAGGCVRDCVLGRTPKDYDVATNAPPPQIRVLFGRKRTLPLGAAFGVITVLGPPGAGAIEVATFRRDAEYRDGRHPDSVTFSTAEEDAARRDFTINGMFYDPIEDRLIDFVGGQRDLEARLIRAIGDPQERFREDKLRLLRAVRFAAALQAEIEPSTEAAIRRMAAEITVVSAERIAVEMQRILVDPHRSRGIRLLARTGLSAAILPEIATPDAPDSPRWNETASVLDRLEEPSFALALAALLGRWVDPQGAIGVCRRWRMSNADTDRVAWLIEHRGRLSRAPSMRWSQLQKLLVADGVRELLALEEAEAHARAEDTGALAWCRELLGRPRDEIDPPPQLTGEDLIRHGVARGPIYRLLLERVRDAQLDGEIHTREEALALVDRILQEGSDEGDGSSAPT